MLQVNGLEVAAEVKSSKNGTTVPVIGGWHSSFSLLVLTEVTSRIDRLSYAWLTSLFWPAVMSAYGSQDLMCKAFQSGAVDFLQKPIRHNEIVTMWRHLWKRLQRPQGERYLPTAASVPATNKFLQCF